MQVTRPPSQGNHVSFVIPHRGREHLLRETLDSIASQQGPVTFDVTVVTQNATLDPETTAYAERMPVAFLQAAETLTISALRNRGAAESRGSHLAFLDADIALSPDWLITMLTLLESDEAIALVSAEQHADAEATPLVEIRTALSNAVVDAPVGFLPGRNLLLRRKSFETVQGFPEHLQTCEDYWFTDRVRELGSLWYSSRASYVHLGEDRRLRDLFRKEVWRGQSNLLSLRGRRVSAGEWPSFLVPPWISLSAILACIFAIAGFPAPAALSAVAALLPFAAYVTRLYFLSGRHISLGHIVAFYAVYFPARAWGTLVGAFNTFGYQIHDR